MTIARVAPTLLEAYSNHAAANFGGAAAELEKFDRRDAQTCLAVRMTDWLPWEVE